VHRLGGSILALALLACGDAASEVSSTRAVEAAAPASGAGDEGGAGLDPAARSPNALAAVRSPNALAAVRSPSALTLLARGEVGRGGAVVLGRLGDRDVALVGDADTHALLAIDLDARSVLSTTPLAGTPSSILITSSGGVLVALRDVSTVEVFDAPSESTAPFARSARVEVPAEPVALATSPGGDVVVVSRWAHVLTTLHGDALEPRTSLDLPRDPVAITWSQDGAHAYVAHAVGGIATEIDAASMAEPRAVAIASHRTVDEGSCGVAFGVRHHPQTFDQSYAILTDASGAILVPGTLVDPIPVVDGLTAGYGGQWWSREPSATFTIASLSERDDAVTLRPSPARGLADCLLPRGAALDPKRQRLLVSCLGRDELVAFPLVDKLGVARASVKWQVPAGPMALAVDASRDVAVVWSDFAGVVTLVSLSDAAAPLVTIPVPTHRGLSAELERGRRLFHDASTSRTAFDGRACASCHLDGRDDAITWTTHDGPRQTPMLMGRLAGTAPFGWAGEHRSLDRHFEAIRERFGGTGFDAGERSALLGYVRSLTPPSEHARADDAPDAPELARGAALFESFEVGCARCHSGELATDRERHDLGTTTLHELARAIDTPSLRFVGRSAPYLHNGRFATVRALLWATDGKMGSVKQLSPEDFDALVRYVESR